MNVRTTKGRSRRAFLALAAAPAVLAACAPGASQPAAQAPLGGKVHIYARGDAFIVNLFQEQAKVFNQDHPTVQVEIELGPQDDFAKFQTLIAAGSPMDAAFLSDTTAGTAQRAGAIQAIDPFLAKQRDFKEADFRKSAWFASTYGGKRWGVPWDAGARFLYFDMAAFEAASVPFPDPKKRVTWDEFIDMGKRLSLDTNGRRASQSGYDPSSVAMFAYEDNNPLTYANSIFSNGGEVLTADGQVPVDSPAAIQALQFEADLRAKHFVTRSPKYPTTLPRAINSFLGSPPAAAIVSLGSAQIGRINQANKRYGILLPPVKSVPAATSAYSPLAMTKQAQNVDAVWAFMYFSAVSERGQRMLVEAGQVQPWRRSLEAAFINTSAAPAPQYRQLMVDALDDKIGRVVGDKTGTYWGGYRGEIQQLWNMMLDPAFRGDVQIAQLAHELRKNTEQLIRTGQMPAINR